jgi:hypothetical protein
MVGAMKIRTLTLAACATPLIGFCLMLIPLSAAVAAEGPGSSGASYLNLTVGAKSIAMGEVSAALIGDPFNWMSNPASLHYMEGTGVGIFHAEWIIDTNYENLNFHHRVNDMFAVTCGFVYSYQPEIQGYDELGVETKMLKSNNYQALIGFGVTPVDAFTAGINVKYFNEKLDEWNADGMAVDLGAIYAIEQYGAAIGVAVQNLGPEIKFESLDEPLPTNVVFGASQTGSHRDDTIDYLLALDLVKPRFEELYVSLGGELTLHQILSIRLGYCGNKYRPGSGFTMGGGFKLKERITFDYAWTPYGDLGSFHRIALYLAIH